MVATSPTPDQLQQLSQSEQIAVLMVSTVGVLAASHTPDQLQQLTQSGQRAALMVSRSGGHQPHTWPAPAALTEWTNSSTHGEPAEGVYVHSTVYTLINDREQKNLKSSLIFEKFLL